MKTKKLIELLMKADPSGDEEVSVGNVDIHFVETLPSYYDGSQQVLIRDETNPYYNIIGAKRRDSGNKIQIHLHDIRDAICDNPDLSIDYSDLCESRRARYKQKDDEWRLHIVKIENDIELRHFIKWAKKIALEIYDDISELEDIATTFFINNLSKNDPLPGDGKVPFGKSYNEVREEQWFNTIKIDFNINKSWELKLNEQ